MLSLKHIKVELEKAWGPSDPAISMCASILSALEALPETEARMLSLGYFKRVSGARAVDEALMKALGLLTSGDHPALVRHFVFFDDDGQEYPVAAKDYEQATVDGWLVHPRTGEPDPKFRERTYLFFDLAPGLMGGLHG